MSRPPAHVAPSAALLDAGGRDDFYRAAGSFSRHPEPAGDRPYLAAGPEGPRAGFPRDPTVQDPAAPLSGHELQLSCEPNQLHARLSRMSWPGPARFPVQLGHRRRTASLVRSTAPPGAVGGNPYGGPYLRHRTPPGGRRDGSRVGVPRMPVPARHRLDHRLDVRFLGAGPHPDPPHRVVRAATAVLGRRVLPSATGGAAGQGGARDAAATVGALPDSRCRSGEVADQAPGALSAANLFASAYWQAKPVSLSPKGAHSSGR